MALSLLSAGFMLFEAEIISRMALLFDHLGVATTSERCSIMVWNF
jgi:hypothetical protein